MNAKMSKSKKKKLKKRAKRNQALMEETMQHIEEREELEKSVVEKGDNNMDEGPSSPEMPGAADATTNGGGDKDSAISGSITSVETRTTNVEGGDEVKVDGMIARPNKKRPNFHF